MPDAAPAAGSIRGSAAAQAAPTRSLSIAVLGDPGSVHVQRWVTWLAGRGHRVTLLVEGGTGPVTHIDPAVKVERYRSSSGWRPRQLGLVASGLSLRRVLGRVRPDVLQVHYLTVNGFRAWVSGFHPRVVTVWGNDVLVDPPRSARARLMARLSLRSADLVTGISGHVIRAAVACGARADRCRVVHFGVDVDLFSPGPDPRDLRRAAGLDGRRVVLSPRIVDSFYRHDVVVKALARLPADVSLVMSRYAAAPAELAAVEELIASLGLSGRVLVRPAIPPADMVDWYRLADVVVSVPETDAGPVTLVEALAVGRPVVCSDLPPVREWLEDIDPAALVPVGDVAATARAIAAALARTPGQLADLARRSRAAVLERADRERTMAEIERLYLALAGA